MNDKDVVMGIDTSNYTTSVGIVTLNGELVANIKCPLPVKMGECGLRQSDALFAHIKNLPVVMERARDVLSGRHLVAIGVSERPRNVDGSYMPVFLAGVSAASSISATLGVPLYKFSHQCGHIMAALYSSGRTDLCESSFAAFHISGGTTELVKVTPCEVGFNSSLVGGTKDLNAGQVIDRVGVMMGMPFPAGVHIEKAALSCKEKSRRKGVSSDGMYINLSGLENMAKKLYDETGDKSKVSLFVLDHIARSIEKMVLAYEAAYGKSTFVFAGGVMSNSIIKDYLMNVCEAYFAEPSLSSDNAVGIACLAAREYKK